MTYEPINEDYQWLVSADAQVWIQSALDTPHPIPARVVEQFRRDLTPEQTSLVLSQAQFRKRARPRFRAAGKMFFTDKGLQQATDDRIATYKATAILESSEVGAMGADFCCGIGGDLTQLAQRSQVVGYDQDPIVVTLATANLKAVEATLGRVETGDVRNVDVAKFDWWHIDPDRRAAGHRTSRVIYSQPNEQELERLLRQNENGSLKLAPAAQLTDRWETEAELEWIGHHRQCQQLWARFGNLAAAHGQRTATTLDDLGQVVHSFTGTVEQSLPPAESIGQFVYEPRPAIIASRLTTALARQLDLRPVQPGIAYLTGDAMVDHPGVERFEVAEQLSFDLRRLKAALRRRAIGQLEIKKRGVAVKPAELQQRLRLSGDQAATLLIFPQGHKTMAVIASRA